MADKQLLVRMSEETYNALKRNAEREELPMASYVRQQLVRVVRGDLVTPGTASARGKTPNQTYDPGKPVKPRPGSTVLAEREHLPVPHRVSIEGHVWEYDAQLMWFEPDGKRLLMGDGHSNNVRAAYWRTDTRMNQHLAASTNKLTTSSLAAVCMPEWLATNVSAGEMEQLWLTGVANPA